MDNSPAWDEALARVEVAPDLEPYVRRDTPHVDPSMRPTKAEYDRYMTLVQIYRQHGWRHEITRLSPFRIADVGTNCILLRADRDLLALAERLGEPAAAAEIAGLDRARRGRVRAASSIPPPACGTARPDRGRARADADPRGLPRLLGRPRRRARSPALAPGSPRRRTRSRACARRPALRPPALLARPHLGRSPTS